MLARLVFHSVRRTPCRAAYAVVGRGGQLLMIEHHGLLGRIFEERFA